MLQFSSQKSFASVVLQVEGILEVQLNPSMHLLLNRLTIWPEGI